MSPNPLTSKRIDAALAILRLVVGTVFIVHGAQKLFIWGLPQTVSGFTQMGVPLPNVVAPLVAVLELFGGVLLIAGLLTRLVALGLTIDMLSALFLVHLPNGFFVPNGIEFVLTLAAANAAFVLSGAGAFSLDAVLAHRRHGRHTTPPAFAARTT
ncbi:MAG: DoxX family protein [Gemmatimonadaceae bacterium]